MDSVYKALEEIQTSEYNEMVVEYITNKELRILEVVFVTDSTFFFSDFTSNIYTDEINYKQVKFFLKVLEDTSIVNINLRKLIS